MGWKEFLLLPGYSLYDFGYLTLSRNAKQSLPKLKDIGDLSAHSRRYNAHRHDIDKIKDDLRLVVQELLGL